MTVRRSVVLGCGSYLPSQILTNAELARKVDTSDEWIVQRTGIHERRIAAPGELTSHMATHAARAALAHAKLDAQAIDLIVLATSTPDNTFPASAVAVQADLGITHGAAFDLQAVCSGFVFALATADALLRSGAFSRALVIGVGDVLAHPRLDRSRHLRAVRRWRRRGRARSAGAAGHARRPRHSHGAAAFRRPPQIEALCRRRTRHRPARSAICAWKAARFFVTPWR